MEGKYAMSDSFQDSGLDEKVEMIGLIVGLSVGRWKNCKGHVFWDFNRHTDDILSITGDRDISSDNNRFESCNSGTFNQILCH